MLAPSHLAAPTGLVHSSVSAASLVPLPGQQQQQSVMAAPQLDAGFTSHQSSMAPAMPAIVLQAEDQPPSDMLKAQAQTLKVRRLQRAWDFLLLCAYKYADVVKPKPASKNPSDEEAAWVVLHCCQRYMHATLTYTHSSVIKPSDFPRVIEDQQWPS